MSSFRKMVTGLKALRELGLQQVGYYILYRLQLRSGYLSRVTKAAGEVANLPAGSYTIFYPLHLPDSDRLQNLLGPGGRTDLLSQADEISSGKVRLFGDSPAPLNLGPANSDLFWADLEPGRGKDVSVDVKPVWEVGRFGWAFALGRAYRVSGDERYPQAFWQYLETFLSANPPYYGLHWTSAQEVALRLIALSFAVQVFDGSEHNTVERKTRLGGVIAAHAARIPPTMSYAKAQGNNHLLVEAAGLYTAGVILPGHPQASRWRQAGWYWSNKALQEQIAPDGSYVQQSTNYHRLMLQTALWLETLAASQKDTLTSAASQRLAAATSWLLSLLDSESGQVPNLGPNDGAYILPLSSCPFSDYRPVLQAAAHAFLGEQVCEPGLWDEMATWLPGRKMVRVPDPDRGQPVPSGGLDRSCQPLVIQGLNSWAYLRTANFRRRPGHADQLHLDLWWRGMNIARDAGTYLYNAAPPWDNVLSSTLVHNTVSVNAQDQMTRAGRFLWLDWAQASGIIYQSAGDGSWKRGAAEHNGYQRLGVIHRREVKSFPNDRWLVEDALSSSSSRANDRVQVITARLHWLLPDWHWSLSEQGSGLLLELVSPHGPISLSLSWQASQSYDSPARVQLVRSGEILAGEGAASPVSGVYSPTYGCKHPALSISVELESQLPLIFKSEWILV